MKQLKLRYESLKKAFDSLQEALKMLSEEKNQQSAMRLIIQDSLIQRFEYTSDLLWKYLKHYLEIKHGINQISPKTVYKECFRVGLLSQSETELALKMVDSRNMTSHVYKEKIATEIANAIPTYSNFLSKIIKKTLP
jgi:nucleotidyltransferase substrate binding protein (TIGR01987 family)